MRNLFIISVTLFTLFGNGIKSWDLRVESISCYVCSSDAAECEKGPVDEFEKLCGEGSYQCFTSINDDKSVERGCITEEEIKDCGEKCTLCKTNLCNSVDTDLSSTDAASSSTNAASSSTDETPSTTPSGGSEVITGILSVLLATITVLV